MAFSGTKEVIIVDDSHVGPFRMSDTCEFAGLFESRDIPVHVVADTAGFAALAGTLEGGWDKIGLILLDARFPSAPGGEPEKREWKQVLHVLADAGVNQPGEVQVPITPFSSMAGDNMEMVGYLQERTAPVFVPENQSVLYSGKRQIVEWAVGSLGQLRGV